MSSLDKDWEAVGVYMMQALRAVAAELGGEAFAQEVVEKAAMSDSAWPDPAILESLEKDYPGAAEEVMTRAAAVQQATHERQADSY
jgi:hypothetical protein